MESFRGHDTQDTQEVLNFKREILAPLGQSDGQPHPQNSVQPGSYNAMPPPPNTTSQDASNNAATIDFTLTSQTPRRATVSQDYTRPHLTSSKSSPDFTNDEVVSDSKMHHSFGGYNGSGDTQPMDTQTFVQKSDLGFSRSIINVKEDTEEVGGLGTADSGTIGRHVVDLENDGEEKVDLDDDVSSLGSDEEELSPETNSRIQLQTSTLFKLPQTPATISRKRNRHGQIISSEIRTSSSKAPASVMRAMFGGGNHATGDISMTQLFRNTQAGSSPPANESRSDPVFERPSPNLRLDQSSPRMLNSSPMRPSTSDGIQQARFANEPLNEYRTVEESQERRAQRLREEEEKRMADALEEDDDFDDSFADSHKRRRTALLRKEAVSGVELTAPRRAASKQKQGLSKSMTELPSNRRAPTAPIKRQPSSDPIEAPVAVPRSHSTANINDSVQVPMTSSRPAGPSQLQDSLPSSPSATRSHIRGKEISTQRTVTVQDSQSDEVKLRVQSSANHLVIQSQYSINSTNTHTGAFERMQTLSGAANIHNVEQSAHEHLPNVIPSSPPQLTEDGDEDEIDLLPSITSQNIAHVSRDDGGPPDLTEGESAGQESTPHGSHAERIASYSDVVSAKPSGTATTAETEYYETADTHRTPFSSNRVHNMGDSPYSPVKRLVDIAAQPSPKRSNESFVMGFDLSDGEKEVIKVTSSSSPVRKRARVYSRNRLVLREPSRKENLVKTASTNRTGPSPAVPALPAVPAEEPLIPIIEPPLPTPEEARISPSKPLAEQGAKPTRKAILSTTVQGRKKKIPRAPSTRQTKQPLAKLNTALARNVGAVDIILPPTYQITSPRRVLALFKDTKLYYYPATFLETVIVDGEKKCKVRFDDGAVAVVDPIQVRKFELLIGDSVKVDLPGQRKSIYILRAFPGAVESSSGVVNDDVYPCTDAFGHRVVQLILRASEATTSTSEEPILVPIDRLYLTGNMLPQFKDRKFIPPLPSRLATPSIAPSEPGTPGSRTRRHTLTAPRAESLSRSARRESDMFTNMSFAVTFVDNPEEKEAINKLVQDHSGSLLNDGFHELFQSLEFSTPKTLAPITEDGSTAALTLKPTAQRLGFAALISDRYCRSQKYLQALALGIPCIHHRWLTDCIGAGSILGFEKYLLPAGESMFLAGAVRSRNLGSYDPCGAGLEDVLQGRPLLLKGATVLLVMGSADRRKAYQFLVYALGASSVKAVHNIIEAKKVVGGQEWVFTDGDADTAREALLTGGGKKRKRGRDGGDVNTSLAATKVAHSEFLVQSLILGALTDL